jgi:hypothetical protein
MLLNPYRFASGVSATPVEYVAGSSTTYVVATSQSVNIPASTQDGDMLLAWVMHRSSLTPPAGWALEKTESCVGSSVSHTLSVYKRTAVSGDAGASTTWVQSSSVRLAVHIQTFRSNAPVAVLENTSRKEDNGSTGDVVNYASITPASTLEMVVHGGTNVLASGTSATTASANPGTLTTPASDAENRLFVAYRDVSSTGSAFTGFFSTNSGGSGNGEVAISVRLGIA